MKNNSLTYILAEEILDIFSEYDDFNTWFDERDRYVQDAILSGIANRIEDRIKQEILGMLKK